MPQMYTAGSFTKNFSWHQSYRRLHTAIHSGFQSGNAPTSRADWRARAGINDRDLELIPLNFFLYSMPGIEDDFLMVDQLVDAAFGPYNDDFAHLALFAFHLAQSGTWRNSKWPDGRVAGWANEFIRGPAWSSSGDWKDSAFLDSALRSYIDQNVEGEPATLTKVFTNYRFLLQSVGVLNGEHLQTKDLRKRWILDAVLLAWDRDIFDGHVKLGASLSALEDRLIEREIFKLLRCDEGQCRVFARAAYAEFSGEQFDDRLEQVNDLRNSRLIAA